MSFDLIARNAEKRLNYLHRYKEIAKIVKVRALEYFPDAKVLVFGSVIKGEVTANSDIDLLIIIDKRDYAKEAEFRADIIKEMFDIPVEIHFASREQFKDWYERFINAYEEV